MARHIFHCIDAHTCGNPVRLVTHGGPDLRGETMAEKRLDFLKNHDWIRTGLMFEPRGHDMMSGSILYPSNHPDADIGVLYIETSGCLPMCGHGTIGTITAGIEYNFISPKKQIDKNGIGTLTIETPAGLVKITYQQKNNKVEWVRLYNVASYLAHQNISINCPELGTLTFDISYGGNFYAILDPQKNYSGLDDMGASKILHFSPIIRNLLNQKLKVTHPEDPNINGISHILWTGDVLNQANTARNAVFYGDHAIDRSPCGTGTSARMAQWAATGKLKLGQKFIHESIIGSEFIGCYEANAKVGSHQAIIPSVQGWAKITGKNEIYIDDDDPYRHGFQLA
ncbi:MAG: hydroxyproline-2-epimerase [Hyphomicrobiales bacterium]|nr:MAG: hydroxyproline-2-epimerase [Hyphomicrobiales bacterium]